MFIAALLLIAKRWKQPKYPLLREQIDKAWYICIMERYSAIKKNKVLIHTTTRMNLEN